jgi:hypothetical protein
LPPVGQSTIKGYDFQYSILAGVFPFSPRCMSTWTVLQS